MAYQRTQDSTKADQNTSILGDSLDAAVNGAITTYKAQVTASDNEKESNFQQLVASGNMSLPDQLAYRQSQLAGTLDSASRATLRTSIATLKAQINQKLFADGYTTQLQNNAAGIESVQNVVSWLQSQLTTATDQTVIDKINSELITQQGNLFNAQQKALSDQTTYAKNSGSSTVISTQISALQSAKATALLGGDHETAANLDLQIQNLQQFQAVQGITMTMQNLGTATITGSSSATGLLAAYGAQIQNADTATPITINGTTYPSANAFWTDTQNAYIADTSSSGLFARVTKEMTDAVNVKNSNNTLSTSDLTSINAQFATLASNPLLQPYAAQMATAKQTALQTAGDALSQVVENNFDQNEDFKTAVTALQAIQGQGVNVDATMQKILNSAANTNSQAVASIMAFVNDPSKTTPGTPIATAVANAIASGAATNFSNTALNGATPGATATAALTADANKTATATPITTPAGSVAPGLSGTTGAQIAALPNLTPGSTGADVKTLQEWLIGQGYSIADGATGNYGTETQAAVAAYQKANNIQTNGNDGYFGPATKGFITTSATNSGGPDAPATGPTATTTTTTPAAGVTLPTAASTTPITKPQATPSSAPTAPASTPTTSVTSAPAVAGTASAPHGSVDYTLHNGETIPQYTARVAAEQSAATYTPPAPITTNWQATPGVTGPTTPAPATTASPASNAAQILKSSSQYAPPTGLTQTKTSGGGTAYSDTNGNLYVQSSPGIYTLSNNLK